jgi:hypothetical protein
VRALLHSHIPYLGLHAGPVLLMACSITTMWSHIMYCCRRYRARPSLLLSAARLAGFSLGAAATAAPPPIRAAVLGAIQDALTEQYNEHLRALREAGLSEEVSRPLGVEVVCTVPCVGMLHFGGCTAASLDMWTWLHL